ncbi:MAG: ybaA [Comamonadaceae bacterium]|nr:MAG: ybaA [Comamonadaceae bacterium]
MNTSTKREAALKLLSTTGIWKSNYAPPGVKLLWRLGIDCPPPHLARFWSVFFVCGLFAGLSFGFLMATYYAIGRKKHRLPLWKDIRASGET